MRSRKVHSGTPASVSGRLGLRHEHSGDVQTIADSTCIIHTTIVLPLKGVPSARELNDTRYPGPDLLRRPTHWRSGRVICCIGRACQDCPGHAVVGGQWARISVSTTQIQGGAELSGGNSADRHSERLLPGGSGRSAASSRRRTRRRGVLAAARAAGDLVIHVRHNPTASAVLRAGVGRAKFTRRSQPENEPVVLKHHVIRSAKQIRAAARPQQGRGSVICAR